jgi:hypothetical protein
MMRRRNPIEKSRHRGVHTLRMCARHPEDQKHDEQVFDRTYNALRRSQELLEKSEKLLKHSGIISEIGEQERKISRPPRTGGHSKHLTAARESSCEA